MASSPLRAPAAAGQPQSRLMDMQVSDGKNGLVVNIIYIVNFLQYNADCTALENKF